MQDAANNARLPVEGQTFQVTLNRSDFSPGDLLQSDRDPQRVYAVDDSFMSATEEAEAVVNTMYMRGIDPIQAPRPVITGTGGEMTAETMAQEWARSEINRLEEQLRTEGQRSFFDQFVTGESRVQVTNPAGEQYLAQSDSFADQWAHDLEMARQRLERVRAHRERSTVEWNPPSPEAVESTLQPAGNLGEIREGPQSGQYTSAEQVESLVDRLRPIQMLYNDSMIDIESEMRRTGRIRRDQAHFAPRDTTWDELVARAEAIEHQQQQDEDRKKMETAVKQQARKSVYKHRFSEAPWFEWLKGREVIVLGAGGIGSWVVFALARIGCSLHVYDMDTIEPHNLGGQMYNMHQVNQNKAEAIAQLAMQFSGNEAVIETYGRFDEDASIGPIVISCFDNMAGRQMAFQKWSEAMASDPENASEYLFIDGRLLAEDYQVYGVTAGRLDAYRNTLFADGDVADAACSFKATTHCSMGIASDMTSLLTNFATNRVLGIDVREVPFSIIKSVPLFAYDLNLGGDEQQEEIPASTDAIPAV